MKKNSIYALMSAIALAGAVGFSGCSSSSDEIIDNPDYNPETNSVKTEFVINVTQPEERTRQLSGDVGNVSFLGFNEMQLVCLTAAPGTAAGADNIIKNTETNKMLPLTPYTGPALDGSDPTITNNSSHVYTLYIPLQTTNFLFYAKTRSTSTLTVDQQFAYGVLENNLSTASTVTGTPTTDIKFNLKPIVSTEATVTTPQTTLLAILNAIAGAKVDETHTWAATSVVNATTPIPTYMMALGNAYDKFTNQASGGDVRQGSSFAILNMVKDLFGSVNEVYSEEANTDAKALAKAVIGVINSYFTLTVAGDSPNETYTWPATSSYKTGTAGETFNSSPYPETQNLPAGSAVIVFGGSTPAFSYVNDGTSGAAAVSAAYNNFTYPSELTYYCNSGLWQTTSGKKSSDYPTTSATWISKDWGGDGWTDAAVSAGTRAVAMKENITYGAAQLVSTIKLEATTFTDNANAVTGDLANNVFDTDNPITLKVHGLLIGSQPDAAQYEYLPSGTSISKVIYDKFSAGGTLVSSTATTNYTLALDNYASNAASNEQPAVNVALEMTADKDFYGKSGMIRAGQKFYLIGSLDPTSPAGDSDITWADHKSFESTDTGYGANRVFIRDAKTEATFKVGETSLQRAYSTIPDLRSTQMLFGISVDLSWKAGLTFNVNL